MEMIKESDLKPLFTETQIQAKITELGNELNKVYGNEELYLVCVLKGSVMFMVDLSKHLNIIS